MIYPHEEGKALQKFLYQNQESNGVTIVEGAEIFVDDIPALVVFRHEHGRKTKNLMATSLSQQWSHSELALMMYETELALNPDTPEYRDVKIRIRPRNDGYDVMAAIAAKVEIYSNS